MKQLVNKGWFTLGVALIALIFSVLALIGFAGSAWIFYQQRELPGQEHAPSLIWNQVAAGLPVSVKTSELNNTTDVNDRFAVLQSQIQVLNSQMNRVSTQASASSKLGLSPMTLAKIDLNCALAELSLGGNSDMAIRFLNEARDELVLAHRPLETALLDHVLEGFAKPAAAISIKQTQSSIVDLEKSLSGLSFVLPISESDFANSNLSSKPIHTPGESAWKSAWIETWARIQSLIIIRDTQTVGEGLITNSSRQATVAAILFNLKDAEAALGAGQWSLFENALLLANARVQVSFQESTERTTWLNSLSSIRAYPLAVQAGLAKSSIEKILDSLSGSVSGSASGADA